MDETEILDQLNQAPIDTYLIMHYLYSPEFKTYTLIIRKIDKDGWMIRREPQTSRVYSADILAHTIHQLYGTEHTTRVTWQLS